MLSLQNILTRMLNCECIVHMSPKNAANLIDKQAYQDILASLERMVTANLFLNDIMIQLLIPKIGQLKLIEEVWALYKFAVLKNIVNTRIVNSTLWFLAVNESWHCVFPAMELLATAIQLHIANKFTYTHTMCTIVKSPASDRTQALGFLVQAAKSIGYVDKQTYTWLISALAKCAEPDQVLGLCIFQDALQENHINAYMINEMLTILAKAADPGPQLNNSLACAILNFGIEYFNIHDIGATQKIDASDLSYGNVYFGLKRTLDAMYKSGEPKKTVLSLAYDTHDSPDAPDVIVATKRVLKEVLHLGITSEWEPGNIKITVEPPKNNFFSRKPSKNPPPNDLSMGYLIA